MLLDDAATSELLDVLSRQAESVSRYQAFVSISGSGPDGGFSAKLVVLFEKPDKLRVELVGPLGGTRWMVVSRSDGIQVFFPKRREYVRESSGREVIGRLLGMRLEPEEILSLLDGTGTATPAFVAKGTAADVRAYRVGPTRHLESGDRRVAVAEDGQVLSGLTGEYRFEYRNDWLERRRQVPRRIRMETDTVRASLAVEELEVNTQLHPDAFVLSIPSDATQLLLVEIGDEAVFARPSPPSEPSVEKRR